MEPWKIPRRTDPSRLPDIGGLERVAFEAALVERGHQRFRARQIFGWIYRRGVTDFGAMSDLPRDLRATLGADFTLTTPTIVARERSTDGTEKFLLRLADGRQIESVFIPDTPAMTFCISTPGRLRDGVRVLPHGQDGSGSAISRRAKSSDRCVLAEALALRNKAFNIVLMGMGEPLHNYDETMKALRILADEHGFALPPRRVTLSTVGLLPALERLAQEPVMPNLAISLHAPTDLQRGELVPINKKYGVADIIEACKRFPLKRRSRITFEYVLLAGVNDSPDDARRLAKLLAGVKSKVNLIPLNAAPGIPFERPSGRGDRPLRAHSVRTRTDGFGAEKPRPRHPRRVRSVDRGRSEAITRPAAGDAGI